MLVHHNLPLKLLCYVVFCYLSRTDGFRLRQHPFRSSYGLKPSVRHLSRASLDTILGKVTNVSLIFIDKTVDTLEDYRRQSPPLEFAFKYCDTRPYNETDPVGFTFLATNACYLISSIPLWGTNANAYASLIDLAGLVSFYYHRSQLHYGPNRRGIINLNALPLPCSRLSNLFLFTEVTVALMLDYAVALTATFATIIVAFKFGIAGYLFDNNVWVSVFLGVVSIVFLVISWFKSSFEYLVWHGIWHVLSAAAVAKIAEAESVLHVMKP